MVFDWTRFLRSFFCFRSMDELDNADEDSAARPSVKELVARIQHHQTPCSANNGDSESSDDEDSPMRMVQHSGMMGNSNLYIPPDPNPNYENVPNDAPRSRTGLYNPTAATLVDSKASYVEPNVRILESTVRSTPNQRLYTSSAQIPIHYNHQNVTLSESQVQNPKYYEQNVNMQFAKLRLLDNSKIFNEVEGTSRAFNPNKMFENTSRMLENPHDAIDRDTNNDSGYSTKVYGSSKGNSPCLSGQTDDCVGASSLV